MIPKDILHADFRRDLWKGHRVLILGLGQYPEGSGMTAAMLFTKLGANVRVTDLKKANELGSNVRKLKRHKNVSFVLGKHRLADIEWAEIVVANPRVRPNSRELQLARKKGIPVTSDIALFMERCKATVIAVTGTRGKSTTSSLIAEMLKASNKKVWLGGNILVSPLTFLEKVKQKDIVVLELSSWQCESLTKTRIPPHISVITNVMRDHLNTYDGMDDYAEAKAQVFRHQREKDIVILNGDDDYCREWIKEAPSEVVTFGKGVERDGSLQKGWLVLNGKRVLPMSKLSLLGEHNAWNAVAAMLAAKKAGATLAGIKQTFTRFKPLANRLEPIRTVNGVTYVNDTCATTPDGAMAALNALKGRFDHLWFIMGGADKELDYRQLGALFETQTKKLGVFLLPGSASDKLYKTLVRHKVLVERVEDMKSAVERAASVAVTDDAVVLSPAAASFGQFSNEFERGKEFVKSVKRIR